MNNTVLISKNQIRWSNAEFKTLTQATSVAQRLVAAKDRYVAISNKTGVPWFIIAVIHEREAGQRWDRNIAQGDHWDQVSIHVPKGRGPFTSFEEAAIDALTKCPPYAAKWTDWSAGGALTLLELYNGLGYENRGIPSPYLWSGTDQYTSGKYVADNVFSPTTVDQQLGCAVLIKAMSNTDSSIDFEIVNAVLETDHTATPTTDQQIAIDTPKANEDTKPASKSTTIWASILGIVTAMGAGISDVVQKAVADWKTVAILAVAGIFGFVIWQRSNKPDIKGIV